MSEHLNIEKWRKLLAHISYSSIVFSIVLALILYIITPDPLPSNQVGPGDPSSAPSPSFYYLKLATWISVASLITSVTSFIGFTITTVLTLRKERREAGSFKLDNAKKELEIEKLRMELAKAKDDKKIIISE